MFFLRKLLSNHVKTAIKSVDSFLNVGCMTGKTMKQMYVDEIKV